MVIETLFPEWKMWTQFLQQTASGLLIDALEESHPIEVSNKSIFVVLIHHIYFFLISGLIE